MRAEPGFLNIDPAMAWLALTRAVSPRLAECELTHLARAPIDIARAQAQHAAYERCLEQLGCELRRLPPAPELPDSVFVEDTAVVLDELAVVTRPGAPSRQPELDAVAEALRSYRPLHAIEAPATLDGGDVLVAGRRVFVGLSTRTNRAGLEQLERALAPAGYVVRAAAVTGCLHLKSAVTLVAPDVLLLNPAWIDPSGFGGFERIEVDPGEPFAGNALRLPQALLHPAEFPRTRERLERHGLRVHPVAADELAKAEGGVTCCSLLLQA